VSAAAAFLRDLSDVQSAFTAQAYAKTAVGLFTKEDCDFYIANREGVIHQAFAVFFFGSGAFHLLLRYPNPRQGTLALQRRQCCTEKTHFGCRMPEVNLAGATRRIGAGQH
jgi:hypothetical protein